jgi:phosphohistidine phosphatase SixA
LKAALASTTAMVKSATMLVVRHEPTWSELAGRLVGGASIRFPTAAAACIEFDADSWTTVGETRGQLVWLVNARLLDHTAIAS